MKGTNFILSLKNIWQYSTTSFK